MRWRVYPIADYPGDLWSDWQDLALRHHAANPMLDACFARLLVKHFADERVLHVLAGRLDQSLATLALVEPARLGRWHVFRPSQAQTTLLVSDPSLPVDFKDMLAAFPGTCVRLDMFALDPREHASFLADSVLADREVAARNICVDVTESFDSYWEGRPRNLKKNLRRYRNRQSEGLGDLQFVVASTPLEVASATDRYGLLESRGWKGQLGTALHPGNTQGEFYRSFLVEMAKQSRAYVFELFADDVLLASRLCVAGSNLLVIFKTTFDEELKRYAAGRLLLHEVLRDVFERGLFQVVDFYTNATDDQMDWATSSRSMVHASVYRSSMAKWAFHGLRAGKGLTNRMIPGRS